MARQKAWLCRGATKRFLKAGSQHLVLGLAFAVVFQGWFTSAARAAEQPSVLPAQSGQVPDATQTDTLKRAAQWLEQGRGRAAYDLLAPLEDQLAGVPEFDIRFGQAALQIDQPSLAAFAFERCLALDASNGLCRLGIARAHISLEERTSARQELAILSQASPPEQVQDVIAKYLGLLSGAEVANQDTRLTSYIQLGIGYDSNLNSAPSRDQMALPAFSNLVFRLSPHARKHESGFSQAKFNISYSAPFATHWRFMTEADIAATGNWDTHRYDTVVSGVNIGVARRANKHQLIGKLQGQNYRVHERDYRNLVGVLGQYSYAVTDRSEASVFVQASRLFYPRYRLRNADRYTAGASWMQGSANDRAVFYVSGYGGKEATIHSNAPRQYDYGFAGVRTGGMYLVTPRMQIEGGVGAENRRYRGQDVLFKKGRRDTVYDAYLGFNYAINRKLSLRPQYRYTHADSNARLYDYQRHAITLNLRYELF